MIKWILLGICNTVMCITLTGCSNIVSGITTSTLDILFPSKVTIRIKSSNDINPDLMGHPSPIVLRIYALTSDDIFNSADFLTIYEEDNILGKYLTAREELEISPVESVEVEIKLNQETTYIGIFAAYRDHDNSIWRDSIRLSKTNNRTYINVKLEQQTLYVESGDTQDDLF